MERVAIRGVGWAQAEAADTAHLRALSVTERYRILAELRRRVYGPDGPGLRETRVAVVGVGWPPP